MGNGASYKTGQSGQNSGPSSGQEPSRFGFYAVVLAGVLLAILTAMGAEWTSARIPLLILTLTLLPVSLWLMRQRVAREHIRDPFVFHFLWFFPSIGTLTWQFTPEFRGLDYGSVLPIAAVFASGVFALIWGLDSEPMRNPRAIFPAWVAAFLFSLGTIPYLRPDSLSLPPGISVLLMLAVVLGTVLKFAWRCLDCRKWNRVLCERCVRCGANPPTQESGEEIPPEHDPR